MIRDLWYLRRSLLCIFFLVSTLVYSNPLAIDHSQTLWSDQQVSDLDPDDQDSSAVLSPPTPVLRDGGTPGRSDGPLFQSVAFTKADSDTDDTKFWKDSVATLNREVYVREQTISYLKEELRKTQVAQQQVQRIKDTVLLRDTIRIMVLDKHRNLVLSIENQALMDSILDVRERLVEKETTILALQEQHAEFEQLQRAASQSVPDTMFVERYDTVFVEVPKKELVKITDTVYVDVPSTEIVYQTDTVFVDVLKTEILERTDTVFVDVPTTEIVQKTDTVFVDVPTREVVYQTDTVFVDTPPTSIARLADTVFVEVPTIESMNKTDTVYTVIQDTVYIGTPGSSLEEEQKFLATQERLQDSIAYLRRISNRMEELLEERQGRVDFLRRQLAWVENQPKIGMDTVYVDVPKQIIDTVFVSDPGAMKELWSENKILNDSISGLKLGLSDTSLQLKKTKTQLVESQKQILEINQQLMAALASSTTEDQSIEWQDSLSRMQQKLAKYKQLIADRKVRIQQLKSELDQRNKQPRIIRDTVEVVTKANEYALRQQIETLTANVKEWKHKALEADSLYTDQTQHIGRLIQVINDVRMEEDSLIDLAKQWKSRYIALQQTQSEGASSEDQSDAAKKFKQEFFEDRISGLKEAQHALVQKEWKAESRLKRIQQREKFLSDWEKNPEQSELFTRIQELEDQLSFAEESRMTVVEVPVPTENSLEIQPVYMFRYQHFIPAYSVKTPVEVKDLQANIRKWFKRRSLKSTDKSKLVFDRVVISELSSDPINVAFEITEQTDFNTVLVSITNNSGAAIGGETGDLADLRIRRFLYELFWFSR